MDGGVNREEEKYIWQAFGVGKPEDKGRHRRRWGIILK